jgi:UDP-glucose:glycoprotein glucosyltransferase
LRVADGRHRQLYQFADGSENKTVVIDAFNQKMSNIAVKKREGFEAFDLFKEENDSENLPPAPEAWNPLGFMGGLFGEESKERLVAKVADADKIHVFSLASGHLYERFMKIMMLSVVRNTKTPVKFWLLSNFLSPQFKKFVPKMAEKFGFEVELVTYHWPDWLNAQTEKQRIIWGYKILFLDVLFPIHVKKIIYVDADQVVRADLKELWDMDLRGAPYGYTPFCAGEVMNEATKGFRFWDSGFWVSHLQGLPYHISALYVVDIANLRENGFGDQIRVTYDGLSRDPGSLSNLDQDLPNYLQHQIPIFSLPQEWLWCETWCTGESKANAKTIDLCNNPLTKVPKLEAALKIIPEWTEYDETVKTFEKSLQ